MNKEEVLKDIYSLEHEIGKCICALVDSRLRKDKEAENKIKESLSSLAIKTQQELSFLYDYINDNIK